jgi:hypothetical protein
LFWIECKLYGNFYRATGQQPKTERKPIFLFVFEKEANWELVIEELRKLNQITYVNRLQPTKSKSFFEIEATEDALKKTFNHKRLC